VCKWQTGSVNSSVGTGVYYLAPSPTPTFQVSLHKLHPATFQNSQNAWRKSVQQLSQHMLHIRTTPVQIETLPNTCRTPPTAASTKTPCHLSLRGRGTRVKSRTSKTGRICRKETRCSHAMIAQRVPLSTVKLRVNKMVQYNT